MRSTIQSPRIIFAKLLDFDATVAPLEFPISGDYSGYFFCVEEIATEIVHNLEQHPEAIVVLMNASYRQTHQNDAYNWKKNGNGSCFVFLSRFHAYLKVKYPQYADRIMVDGFALADVEKGEWLGSAFEEALYQLDEHAYAAKPPTTYGDDLKIHWHDANKRALFTLMVRRLFQVYPHAEQYISVYDDRDDIVQDTRSFFGAHRFLLSKKQHLRISAYENGTLKSHGEFIKGACDSLCASHLKVLGMSLGRYQAFIEQLKQANFLLNPWLVEVGHLQVCFDLICAITGFQETVQHESGVQALIRINALLGSIVTSPDAKQFLSRLNVFSRILSEKIAASFFVRGWYYVLAEYCADERAMVSILYHAMHPIFSDETFHLPGVVSGEDRMAWRKVYQVVFAVNEGVATHEFKTSVSESDGKLQVNMVVGARGREGDQLMKIAHSIDDFLLNRPGLPEPLLLALTTLRYSVAVAKDAASASKRYALWAQSRSLTGKPNEVMLRSASRQVSLFVDVGICLLRQKVIDQIEEMITAKRHVGLKKQPKLALPPIPQ